MCLHRMASRLSMMALFTTLTSVDKRHCKTELRKHVLPKFCRPTNFLLSAAGEVMETRGLGLVMAPMAVMSREDDDVIVLGGCCGGLSKTNITLCCIVDEVVRQKGESWGVCVRLLIVTTSYLPSR